MPFIGGGHLWIILLVLAIILIIYGPGKLPEVGGAIGRGIREFRKASSDLTDELKKGSELCTSVASTASLLLTGNVKIDMKPLTQAKLEDLAKLGSDLNADLKLKFGSIEVDIQKGDLRSDMKVSAPNSTSPWRKPSPPTPASRSRSCQSRKTPRRTTRPTSASSRPSPPTWT